MLCSSSLTGRLRNAQRNFTRVSRFPVTYFSPIAWKRRLSAMARPSFTSLFTNVETCLHPGGPESL